MNKPANLKKSRRQLLKVVGATTISAGLSPAIIPSRVHGSDNTLRILRWKNFIPKFENWFNNIFVQQWEQETGIRVIVDNVGMGDVDRLAAQEALTQQGHDMVLFLSPRPLLEDHVIDHHELFEECERQYGKAHDFVYQSCFNPVTNKFHGFCESYIAVMQTYRNDLWNAVGIQPDSWDKVREGGRAIKLLHDAPTGISFANEHNGEQTLRALMSCYGASVQNEDGRPSLKSAETIESLKFAKALYEEAMTPDVLNWTPPSNNQFMLSGTGCWTVDTISIIRAAQTQQFPVNEHLALAPLPEGPAGRTGSVFGANIYMIWRFARNPEAAKRFLIDYMANISDGIEASGFQNLPSFPNSVPDLGNLIRSDAGPAGRYELLKQIPNTQTNLGYPGYTNAAIDEVLRSHTIPNMFSQAITGTLSPEEAMLQADEAIKPIFQKWKTAGKI